jgi:hypothetical protein
VPIITQRVLRLILLAALVPGWLLAQQPMLGAALTALADGGEGVGNTSCVSGNHLLGLGARLSAPAFTDWTSLQVNVRGYGINLGDFCLDGFPPAEGTYIQDDRIDLVTKPFVTTDARLAARVGESPIGVALGVGNAWHQGDNLQYGVFGAEITLVSRPTYEISVGGELQLLRVTSYRFRRTYQDFTLVSEELLGRLHRWSHGLVLGVSASGAL